MTSSQIKVLIGLVVVIWAVTLLVQGHSLTTIIRKALDRKLQKLVAEPVARHVLLLEKA